MFHRSAPVFALSLIGACLASSAFAQLLNPPPNPNPEPPPRAEAPQAVAPAPDEEKTFTVFRQDLINLLILRADGRLLAAAAQIATPDEKDPKRSAAKKTPGLLKRAQQFAPQDPLVLWVASSNACLSKPGCADPAALNTLQTVDADNAAVWLLAFPTDGNAVKARPIIARMALAQRYDDYWAANVVALYHALETLPVPKEVTQQGVSSAAARVSFASRIASAILPTQAKTLGKLCTGADKSDSALVADCIAVARKLETGGTFISQATGFAIEDALLEPGVDRDVMATRKRSAQWQGEKFFELSARFPRDGALAESYIRLLGSEQTALGAVPALLREQNLHTDPPGGWEPAPAQKMPDPLQSPAPPPVTQQ